MDLTVISTYRCNSKCRMCHAWQNPTSSREEVSLQTLSKLPGGFDNLNISGGEPTLRKDLVEMVDILYPKSRIMEVSSNGLHYERLLPIIKKYPDIKVRFSLEGTELVNRSIRGETGGFYTKVNGLRKLQEAGGTDLGFAIVIQDQNAPQLMEVYKLTQLMGVELATSTLHNAWQFHKNDNYIAEPLAVAREVEHLITAMLKTRNVKNWFRAYLNLGLIRKILGQERMIKCTAGTDFIFVDPRSDVWACNVRGDVPMGNLGQQSWEEIINSEAARYSCQKVADCRQNCWMVTTARTAMRSRVFPAFPSLQPLGWVIKNKVRATYGVNIPFDQYIDYSDVRTVACPRIKSVFNKPFNSKIQNNTHSSCVQKELASR